MFLPSPSGLGGSLLPVALVGIQARGFSLRANGEALRSTLTNEGLVHIRQSLFESAGIEVVGDDGVSSRRESPF